MRFLETKHERNSAKITTLLILILALLLFVVGPQYMDPPIEYGVAINFGEQSSMNAQNVPDMPTKSEEIIEDTETEDVSPEDEILEEEIDELIEEPQEEIVEEQTQDPVEEQLEKEAQEQADAERAAEELLAEQEAEAERLKAEKEAKEKEEAERFAAEKAKAEKDAREKAEREASAKAEREAKTKAAREAKERADREARAKAANAEADRKAAAAAAEAKNKSGASNTNGFNLDQRYPIYKGCEGETTNEGRMQCMKRKVSQFFDSNFDKDLAGTLGFTGDQTVKIYFKISETGQIVDIRVRANHTELVKETKRVIRAFPEITPARQQGKPKAQSFSTLISFKAQ